MDGYKLKIWNNYQQTHENVKTVILENEITCNWSK